MNITKGKIKSAQKVVIYGPEGIGKSTFASQFPNPLFIDTEGSTKTLMFREWINRHRGLCSKVSLNISKTIRLYAKQLLLIQLTGRNSFALTIFVQSTAKRY